MLYKVNSFSTGQLLPQIWVGNAQKYEKSKGIEI